MKINPYQTLEEGLAAIGLYKDNVKQDVYVFLKDYTLDILYNHHKYFINVIDTGYDVSDSATRTHYSFEPADYKTLRDFFDEPNGNIYPTYCSGHGLASETHESFIIDELNRFIYDWFREHGFILLFDNPDIDDELCDPLYRLAYGLLDMYLDLSFENIIDSVEYEKSQNIIKEVNKLSNILTNVKYQKCNIITIVTDIESMVFDTDQLSNIDGDDFRFYFRNILIYGMHNVAGITLRQFTDDKIKKQVLKKIIDIPIKLISGYLLNNNKVTPFNKEEQYRVYTTDAHTREFLPLPNDIQIINAEY